MNTGGRNTGDGNTGDWNTGDWNTGYCNSITLEDILVFNKPCKRKAWENANKPNWMYVNLTKWISDSEMTDEEKKENSTFHTTGGYLKSYSSLQDAYKESWDKALKEDKQLTFQLPNFDIKVFEEVFGFFPIVDDKVKITVDGKDTFISRESAKALNLID